MPHLACHFFGAGGGVGSLLGVGLPVPLPPSAQGPLRRLVIWPLVAPPVGYRLAHMTGPRRSPVQPYSAAPLVHAQGVPGREAESCHGWVPTVKNEDAGQGGGERSGAPAGASLERWSR